MEDNDTRPEQTFFDDPALDRVMGVVLALAMEVYVLRARHRALEAVLTDAGMLAPGQLDAEPTDEESAASAADSEAFVTNLLQSLMGRQQSKGPVR